MQGCRISLGWSGVESDENPKERYAHSYMQITASVLLGRTFLCPEKNIHGIEGDLARNI
jgi:hypothetical protein